MSMIDQNNYYIRTCVDCEKQDVQKYNYAGQSKLRYCDDCFLIHHPDFPTKYEKVMGRNLNEEFMVKLWNDHGPHYVMPKTYSSTTTPSYVPPITAIKQFGRDNINEKSQCHRCREGSDHEHEVIVSDPRKTYISAYH